LEDREIDPSDIRENSKQGKYMLVGDN